MLVRVWGRFIPKRLTRASQQQRAATEKALLSSGSLLLTGEDVVRTQFATKSVYGLEKQPLVELWLRLKIQGRKDSLNSEHIELARDATAAAWDAARAAKTAANTAKIALVIAAISIIISTINLFL